MEMHKLRYLRDFCYRTGKSLKDLQKIIEDNEVKIRHCYSETFEQSSKEFINMILLDGIFIIELFLRTYKYDENDYIVNKPWLKCGLGHDLILLENQLPFFVLEKLYSLAFSDSTSTFIELSLYYFPSNGMQQSDFENIGEVKHLTDFVRYFYKVPRYSFYPTRDPDPLRRMLNRYCATKLDDAGLKFKAVERRHFLEIKLPPNRWFKIFPCFPCLERMQRILEVPAFEIDNNTEALFRNLMALEQLHYPRDASICSYVELLDCLIDTEKNVNLLVDKNVIINKLGSNDEVATLFNKPCTEIGDVKYSCYNDLGPELKDHYDFKLNHILATMKSVYFRDFWRGTATVVGLIVLGVTFVNFLRPFFFHVHLK